MARGTDDAVTVAGGNGVYDTADDADTISVTVSDASIAGSADGDTATVYGNGGDDTINIDGDGSATVFGGAGDDTDQRDGGCWFA